MNKQMFSYGAPEANGMTPKKFSQQYNLLKPTPRNTNYQQIHQPDVKTSGAYYPTNRNRFDPVSLVYIPQTDFDMYNDELFFPCYYQFNKAVYPMSNEANPLSNVMKRFKQLNQ